MRNIKILSWAPALIYLRLMEFKNNLKLTLMKPLGLIGTICKILLPLTTIIYGSKLLERQLLMKEEMLSFPISGNMIGAIITLLLMVIFFISLKKAVDDYYPTQYVAADVNLLFTSPIGSRMIYAWSMGKQVGIALFVGLFTALPLFFMLRVSHITASLRVMIYACSGISLFILVVQTMRFFIYSISKRFQLATLLKTLILIGQIAGLAYLLIVFLGYGVSSWRVFQAFDVIRFERIPVIGWTESLIIGLFLNVNPIPSLIKMIILVVAMLFISIYLATDYYEEALSSTERMAKVKAAITGNNIEAVHNLISKKKVRVKRARFHWLFGKANAFRKAYAFLWKAIIINPRQSKGAFAEIIKYVFWAVVGGVFGYMFRDRTYRELIMMVIVLGMIMKKGNASLVEGLEYELKKNYLFLLPGRARDKILAINLMPVLKTLVRNLVIVLPMALFIKVNGIQLSTFWVVFCATNLMNLFAVVVMKVIFPVKERNNFFITYLSFLFEILLELPAVGMGVLTYLLFKKIEVALLIFGIGGLLTVMGLLELSEALFGRLELSN
ncbi:MAG TPA: putative ABC exporter domain-containing protein [Bacillota bacterium]|nr:putative ABC exporter domain-containing protein [Bacillota bacterium]